MTLTVHFRKNIWHPASRQLTVPFHRVQALTTPYGDYERCDIIVRGVGECRQNRYSTDKLRHLLAEKAGIELIAIEEYFINPHAVATVTLLGHRGSTIVFVGNKTTLSTEWSVARTQQVIRRELREKSIFTTPRKNPSPATAAPGG